MDNPDDIIANLQKKLSDLSDYVDELWYQFTKKTGSSGASIYGSVINSVNFVTGISGWQLTPDGNLEANAGTFRGKLQANSIDIPDTTTTSSFHVDNSGNAWWGANVANGLANALASITPAGLATFKNILVGGSVIQYQIVNGGMQSFGDGSDGAGVADGVTSLAGASLSGSTYTLTRDVYYTSLVVSTGVIIKPSGYRIFGTGALTLNGTATIQRDGNAGVAGPNSSGIATAGGAGGAALPDGYLKGSLVGGVGGATTLSTGNPGVAGGDTTNSIGVNGVAGGASNGQIGGAGGTATASNVKLIANWHLATLLDVGSTGATVKFDNSAAGGGGASGGGVNPQTGGGGGGAGSGGGILAIYFRSISVGASASITVTGGAGGNGGNGGGNGTGPGGGGAGGNGGQVILVYNILTNSGTISATGGAKGLAGTNGAGASDGTVGTDGSVRPYQISM